MKSVSIVIATADRPGLVLDCVRSWREQVPADVELLVVDAGRELPVDEDALLALWPNARVIRSQVRNAGVQRNMGVQVAGGGRRIATKNTRNHKEETRNWILKVLCLMSKVQSLLPMTL